MELHTRQLFDSLVFGTFAAILILGLVELQEQSYGQFFEQDPAVSFYNGGGDIVPTMMMAAIVIPVSIVVILLYFFAPTKELEDSNKKIKGIKTIIMLFGCFTASVCSFIATNVLKKVVGRPRPMALYGCNYMGYKDAVTSGNFTSYYALTTFGKVGDSSNCFDSAHREDMWSSFPSGHASFSFVTMVFTHLVLRKTLLGGENDKDMHFGVLSLVAYSPLVLCAWISATRIIDQKHHVDDVLSGMLIGVVCAVAAWRTVCVLCRHTVTALTDSAHKKEGRSESEMVQRGGPAADGEEV
jgi:phosphatidate phosphatase